MHSSSANRPAWSGSGSAPPTSPCSQNEPPSTRKYSSLKSAILYQSGRSGSSRIGRLPGLDRRPPVRRLGERVAGQVPGAVAAPAPVARVALPPAASRAELDDRQVPGRARTARTAARPVPARRSPRRRPRSRPAVADLPGWTPVPGRSSRPSDAKSAHSSVSWTGSNAGAGAELHAVAAEGRDGERPAQRGRGASAAASPKRTPSRRRRRRTTSCGRPGAAAGRRRTDRPT